MKKREINFKFFVLFIFFVLSCNNNDQNEKEISSNSIEITSNYKEIKLDSNWKGIRYKNGDILYYPRRWKLLDKNYTAYFQIDNETFFYLDIMHSKDTTEQELEEKILNSLKGTNVNQKGIIKLKFNKKDCTLYHYEILANNNIAFLQATNFFKEDDFFYNFTIASKKGFNEKYLDTLEIITNSYIKNGNERLIPFAGGYKSADIIKVDK